MSARQPVRLEIVTTPPPAACEGRPTEFGLQDRKEVLQPGAPQPGSTVLFSLEVEVSTDPATGAARFYGPWAQGPAAGRFLYLGWRYQDGAREWVRRQKLPLTSISWERIQAAEDTPVRFRAEVPPITERCATIPVEWVAG
jgi:hypothetical protein